MHLKTFCRHKYKSNTKKINNFSLMNKIFHRLYYYKNRFHNAPFISHVSSYHGNNEMWFCF